MGGNVQYINTRVYARQASLPVNRQTQPNPLRNGVDRRTLVLAVSVVPVRVCGFYLYLDLDLQFRQFRQ